MELNKQLSLAKKVLGVDIKCIAKFKCFREEIPPPDPLPPVAPALHF